VTARVYLTGRVRIESAGRLIDEQRFPARQGRVLFAYLMCRRHRPLTRNELAEVVWPDTLPSSWEVALNALVSKLRVLLKGVRGSPLKVISAFGTYVVEVGDDVWIDRESAAEAADSAEALLRAGRWRAAWGPSNIAAITARQGFLAGEEGEWIEQERARLHAILVRALDCLSQIWLLNSEPSLALGTTKEVVALEPFREAGYRQLMRVHAALGNRAEALRTYEACRELLARELGAAPSPETRRVHEEIQRGEVESVVTPAQDPTVFKVSPRG
jgi:SARP family transcriptional regulator, regulator of embCAB operon